LSGSVSLVLRGYQSLERQFHGSGSDALRDADGLADLGRTGRLVVEKESVWKQLPVLDLLPDMANLTVGSLNFIAQCSPIMW
jgi:hypothetical protein